MKQTAVEWLLEEFKNFTTNAHFDRNGYIIKIHKANMVDLINKAKEMEKQQIIDAWEDGHDSFSTRNAEQYYNETYGK
jgi:hypothetical protein